MARHARLTRRAALAALVSGVAGKAWAATPVCLSFEHLGPEDASWPITFVKIGPPAESRGTTFRVTARAMVGLAVLVRSRGTTALAVPRKPGSFKASIVNADGQSTEVLLEPDATLAVVEHLERSATALPPASRQTLAAWRRLVSP